MRAMASHAPSGLIGGLGGAVGALPIVSAAREMALRIAPAPQLPGAEWLAGDVKLATYAEAAALLVAVPLAALVFGALLPRWLETRIARDVPSFEWAAAGFACAFPIWRAGVPARWALLAGLALAAGIAVFLLLGSGRHFGSFEEWHATLSSFATAAAAWEIARKASGWSLDSALLPLCLAAALAALPFFFLPIFPGVRSRA